MATTTYLPTDKKTEAHRLKIRLSQTRNGLRTIEANHQRKVTQKQQKIAELEARLSELVNN